MSLAIVYSRASLGIHAPLVTVEAHLSPGLPRLTIVGLPETAVKESKDRVRSAIMNSQFDFPIRNIIINLGPADLPKEGGRFDLAIAIGILAASKQLPANILVDYEFAGELALSGELRAFDGALPFALATQAAKRRLILPSSNAMEAALAKECEIFPANHLLTVCHHLCGKQNLLPQPPIELSENHCSVVDLSDVREQALAKRALEIAAAGEHSMLMVGPPGTGKTMLASRLPTLLPELTDAEALETAAIASLCKRKFDPNYFKIRPFRAPHHTASSVALVGGGSLPRPGEISLAHNGVLFLDELPEFNRHALETLREPLESGKINISRAAKQAEFPARFQLVAAMNPCPCGYLGDPNGRCHCSPQQIQHYRAKISGPFLDRIDLHLEVQRIAQAFHSHNNQSETSAIVRARVNKAREKQYQRVGKTNSRLTNPELESACNLSDKIQTLLNTAMTKLNLSGRGIYRVLRIARTIADLDDCTIVLEKHVLEALNFRVKLK